MYQLFTEYITAALVITHGRLDQTRPFPESPRVAANTFSEMPRGVPVQTNIVIKKLGLVRAFSRG